MVAVRTSQVPLVVKNPPANAKDVRNVVSVPGLGISSVGGLDSPLQYSCLEKLHGQRSLVGYSSWGHKESDATEQLRTHSTRQKPSQ